MANSVDPEKIERSDVGLYCWPFLWRWNIPLWYNHTVLVQNSERNDLRCHISRIFMKLILYIPGPTVLRV